MIEVNNLCKSYKIGKRTVDVIKNISFSVSKGEKVAIIGPSGSGKSTLLNILSRIDNATSGTVIMNGKDICKLSPAEADKLRLQHFGFIFQAYHLIPTLTVKENIALPVIASNSAIDDGQIEKLCEHLGLRDRINHYPHQLSGGEQQRTAVARAIITNPDVIFSDEATGNLDAENSKLVMELIIDVCKQNNTSLIYVTHDLSLSHYADKIIDLGLNNHETQ